MDVVAFAGVSSLLVWALRKRCATSKLDYALLQKQDAETSEEVIAQLRAVPLFVKLSTVESAETAARDKADDEKLQAGIDLAVAKGVLPAGLVPAPYHVRRTPLSYARTPTRQTPARAPSTDHQC